MRHYEITGTLSFPLVGANSNNGSNCGFFALNLNNGSTNSNSNLRGREAIKKHRLTMVCAKGCENKSG